MTERHLYKISYKFLEFGTWRNDTKNIVANGSAESALRKANTVLKKLEPDVTRLTVTSVERICRVDAL